MPDNKKHHFVPQFYLRKFSADGKSINLVNVSRAKVIEAAPIKSQCYRDYFYGRDGQQEKGLSLIEGAAAVTLKRMIEHRKVPFPGSEEFFNVLIYLLVQRFRTSHTIDGLDEMTDRTVKYILGPQMQQKFPDIDVKKFKITLTNITGIAINTALTQFIGLMDLKWLLVGAEKGSEFVVGDNPVAFTNPLLHGFTHVATTALTSRGLVVFFPLSPELTLVLYDTTSYRSSDAESVFVTARRTEVETLNRLQCATSYENFYYHSRGFDALKILDQARRYRHLEKSKQHVYPMGQTASSRRELLIMERISVDMPINLSFLRNRAAAVQWRTKFTRAEGRPLVVERNPFLSQVLRSYKELLKKDEPPPEILDYLNKCIEGLKPGKND